MNDDLERLERKVDEIGRILLRHLARDHLAASDGEIRKAIGELLDMAPQGGSRTAGPLLDDMPDATEYDGGMGSGKWLGQEVP